MTYNTDIILDAYRLLRKADRPEITEEFANKMVEREKALNTLEIRTEADPVKKINAFNEVVKNEGAKVIFYSADKLAVLVSEALRSINSICA